jgi:hypothetical protein
MMAFREPVTFTFSADLDFILLKPHNSCSGYRQIISRKSALLNQACHTVFRLAIQANTDSYPVKVRGVPWYLVSPETSPPP